MGKFEIKMPKLGESITEGTIISWMVQVGDTVQEDDVLFEVNTAKVSAEIPSPVGGKIIEILYNEGDTVAVGTVVAIIGLDGEEGTSEPTNTTQPESEPAENPVEVQKPADSAESKITKAASDRWYSPVVMQIAKSAALTQDELDAIPGTGYQGRLSKRDIERYVESKKQGATPIEKTATPVAKTPEKATAQSTAKPQEVKSQPVATQPGDTVIPMDPVRRIIADRMVASKNISAHVTNVIEVDVTKLVKWREENKEAFKQREGISLTYMPAIIEASVKALKDFPRVNSSVDGYNIIEKKHINMGVAVSLDDGNLIVPVIKDADKQNLTGLASSVHTLANKARSNKLLPDDIQGGTFTITNFGSFKSIFGTPIINQPEVAILGVGVIEKKPSVIETPEGDVIAIRQKMHLSLSYDHRVIDGMLGGNFLHRIATYLENWNP